MLIEFVVAKGKKELGRSYAHVDDDSVTGAADGPAPRPADIVFTVTPEDAEALRSGALDLSVGFMRGQVKMAGDFGTLLRFLPATYGADASVPVPALFAS
jgi:putative sterol carrier protein